MGDVVHFRRVERSQRVPAPGVENGSGEYLPEDDDSLLFEAYGAAHAAAERYERERRKEREMLLRLEALTRENVRLKAELIRLKRG